MPLNRARQPRTQSHRESNGLSTTNHPTFHNRHTPSTSPAPPPTPGTRPPAHPAPPAARPRLPPWRRAPTSPHSPQYASRRKLTPPLCIPCRSRRASHAAPLRRPTARTPPRTPTVLAWRVRPATCSYLPDSQMSQINPIDNSPLSQKHPTETRCLSYFLTLPIISRLLCLCAIARTASPFPPSLALPCASRRLCRMCPYRPHRIHECIDALYRPHQHPVPPTHPLSHLRFCPTRSLFVRPLFSSCPFPPLALPPSLLLSFALPPSYPLPLPTLPSLDPSPSLRFCLTRLPPPPSSSPSPLPPSLPHSPPPPLPPSLFPFPAPPLRSPSPFPDPLVAAPPIALPNLASIRRALTAFGFAGAFLRTNVSRETMGIGFQKAY